ncbi:hypothetical protein SO694_00162039 [Aureococcus anophagefferens]|uniref:Uncharacterized protein n=1 Tax=Aureococcus anophagefferens TaxID=44056 RepID=A0ABR1G5U0_AURAN
MRRIFLLLCGARALVAPGPARGRRALRHAFDGDGDGFATSSDSFDVMDDEGWVHEGEERDAGVTIHASMDRAEEPVDASTYFFGNEDDDAELRRLLGELEAEFAGEADAASASILDSVRSCHERRGRGRGQALGARGGRRRRFAEAYAANGAASAQDDDEYSWLLGNATAAARGGGAAASGRVPALPRVAAAEVSAEVVRKLRDDAIACLAEAGAAPPAGCSGAPSSACQRPAAPWRATITAARLGGFDAVHLITEPEAAALAYGSRVRGDSDAACSSSTWGGTFDASVVLLAGRTRRSRAWAATRSSAATTSTRRSRST